MARILFAALLLLFTLPAAAQTPGDSIAFVTADWHTTDLGRGAACRYAQVEMFGSRQSISVVSYPHGTSPRRSYSSTARVKPRAAWAKPPTPQQPSTAAIST